MALKVMEGVALSLNDDLELISKCFEQLAEEGNVGDRFSFGEHMISVTRDDKRLRINIGAIHASIIPSRDTEPEK